MAIVFDINGKIIPHRIFCIGRNFHDHIKELAPGKPETPSEPVVFMKPVPSLVPVGEVLHLPPYGRELHHEAEIVVLIGKEGKNLPEEQADAHIAGLTLGLDLTLRDVQNELKGKGLPWELCKAFDQSAPIGKFLPYKKGSIVLENIPIKCTVNGALRQNGNSSDMIFPIKALISYLSKHWLLKPGDLVYTGTPSGVGPLRSGDKVSIGNEPFGEFSWVVG
jgi:2-keto-4-pentenoate hydratase/2-oxohepta-3-ene-1,7-dioic acid hydratase in catechol pathway